MKKTSTLQANNFPKTKRESGDLATTSKTPLLTRAKESRKRSRANHRRSSW